MDIQQIQSLMRKCIEKYNLINENDKIAIASSGGKDSLTLSMALNALKRYFPLKFDLIAITIDLGFKNVNFDQMKRFYDNLGIELYIKKTEIADIVFDIRKEENPCSLCSKLRKGAINPYAKSLGCNKIALGHNKDDLIETSLLELIYEGKFSTFKPITYLDRTDITIIRPMLYIDECDIVGFANKNDLPIIKSKCPADGNTKREYTKNLMLRLDNENKGAKRSLFNACINFIDNNYVL